MFDVPLTMIIIFDAAEFRVDFGIAPVEDPTSDDPRVNMRLPMGLRR